MKRCMVHIEDSKDSMPRAHELLAAEKIASILESEIIFLRRVAGKTPDLYILKTNVRWELKSPEGGGKHTIQNNLREASLQSENIILDLSRTKLSDRQGLSRAKEFIEKEKTRIRRVKVLTKSGDLVDLK